MSESVFSCQESKRTAKQHSSPFVTYRRMQEKNA